MRVLDLPTDNLYKFLALSGIMLIITSIIFPFQFATEVYKQAHITSGEISILSQKIKNIQSEIDSLGPPLSAEYFQEKDKLENLQKELEIESLQLQNKNNLTIQQAKNAKTFTLIGALSAIIGFVISSIGFSLWYCRLQKYQDLIIKNKTII